MTDPSKPVKGGSVADPTQELTGRSDCVPMRETRSCPTRRRLRFYPRKDSIPRSTPMTSRSDCVPMRETRSRPTRRRLRFYPRKDSIPRSTQREDGWEGPGRCLCDQRGLRVVCGPWTQFLCAGPAWPTASCLGSVPLWCFPWVGVG